MEWRQLGAIGFVLMDEIGVTLLYFGVLPLFNIHLPLKVYLAIMCILVVKDILVVKFLWHVVVRTPQIGKESLIGKIGIASTDLDSQGVIRIGNELWIAETQHAPVKKGGKVIVLNVNGLYLEVDPVNSDDGNDALYH
ncbi:MAG: NfeD family protein [Theionarchaea archaeon]|nr:NfeD family protein [Theionarchaea archaeon]